MPVTVSHGVDEGIPQQAVRIMGAVDGGPVFEVVYQE